jgi:hypothetical protein
VVKHFRQGLPSYPKPQPTGPQQTVHNPAQRMLPPHEKGRLSDVNPQDAATA